MGKKKYKCVVYRYINDADGGKSYVGYTIDEQVRRAQFQNLKYKYSGAKINAARE